MSPSNLPQRLRIAAARLRDTSSSPSTPILSTTEIDDLRKVVPSHYHDFLDVFSKDIADTLPDHRPGIDHPVDVEEGKEIPTSRIYPLSASELEVLADYIETNLKSGFIRESQSPVGAPILFVKKKDGSLRLCVDYRGLNSFTIKNKYPLPLINETLDRLIGARYFTKIDLRNGYHQLRIREGDEWKTAFRTRYGHYEYNVMPFGLTNAPASFQSLINNTLCPFLDRFVVAYLDDILIYSETLEEHQDHVRQVLAKMREAKLYAKAEKCSFHSDQVEYLGFITGSHGVSMDASKVKAIREWPQPTTVKEVQSFLGFANFYRRFIKNYSSIASPLTRLTRKDTPFEMDDKAIAAFQSLKDAFEGEQILRHFDPSLPLELETDASDFALGAVLSQRQDGQLHPIAFLSRKFSPPELNYEVHDKELLAIVEACKAWRAYLSHTQEPSKIFSDHFNLKYFFSSKTLNRRQARWQEALSELNFTLIHRPGKQQGKTDALSRRADYQDGTRASDSDPITFFPPSKITSSATFIEPFPDLLTSIRDEQDQDDDIRQVLQDIRLNENLDKLNPRWKLGSDQLLRWDDRLYVPNSHDLRLRILRHVHDDISAGHPGIDKTFNRLRREFYWPQDKQFVINYVNSCEPCFRGKPRRTKAHGLLQPLPVPSRPWSSIALDFIVKLPPSSDTSNDSILVITDRLTKFGLFIPCKEEGTTARVFADLFYKFVFTNHGLPDDIVSDRGSVFTSDFWTTLSRLTRTKLNLSTAFHPQTDGATERLNQTLEQYLRIYTNYQQDDWETLFPLAQYVYNDTVHSATKTTPFFANFGYHPRFSVDIPSSSTPSIPRTSFDASAYAQSLQRLHETLRSTLQESNDRMKRNYDKNKSHTPSFAPGDLVWLSARHIHSRRISKKLDHKNLGPFRILEKIGDLAYKLDLPKEMKVHPTFHVSLLHAHQANTIPNRIIPPPPLVVVDGQEEHEVEEILDSRSYHGKLQYRIRWKGYGPTDDTWEHAQEVENSPELIEAFHQKYPSKPTLAASTPTSSKPRSKRRTVLTKRRR